MLNEFQVIALACGLDSPQPIRNKPPWRASGGTMADNDNGPADAADLQPARGQRILEIAVYVMGAMLIAAVFILIGGIIWKATHRADPPPPETRILDLDLSAASVTAMDLDGDRLAIRSATEIVVVDTRKGIMLSRIRLKP